MGVTGRNHGTYGSQPCGLRLLSVVVAIVGLGGYTYIYVGDINPSRKIRCVNPPRGRDAPRHVSTSGHVLSGWGRRRATARLYIGIGLLGHYIYVGDINSSSKFAV